MVYVISEQFTNHLGVSVEMYGLKSKNTVFSAITPNRHDIEMLAQLINKNICPTVEYRLFDVVYDYINR